MKNKQSLNVSGWPLLGAIALVVGIGLVGCSTAVDSKVVAGKGITVEVAGLGSAGRSINTDAAVTAGAVVVNAYLVGAPYTFLGTTGSMTRNGTTNYTGSIPSLSSYGNTVFRAFVKGSTGNFLYAGDSAAQVTSALTTAVTAPIVVSVKTNLATVNLDAAVAQGTYGSAGQYVILAQTTVTSAGGEVVTGDIAVSPAAQSFLTGWSLTGVTTDVGRGSAQVTGQLFGADSGVPTPANLTEAVSNMVTAYNDAAGRPTPDVTELGAGDISGMTIVPGLYKWGTAVSINTDLTLNGGPNDIWIFQVAGTLALANATNITLTGGALPQNIFWQASGAAGVTIGTTAQFKGIVLALKQITVNTSAVVTGRLLSQTAVTLAATDTVTHP